MKKVAGPAATSNSGAQPAGCSTVVATWKSGGTTIEPVKPHTVAKSLAMGNPADGYYALRAIQETGGDADDASDPEIIEAMQLLAQTEGIFAETAGGVTIAVLKKLAARGVFRRDETVVALITGNGLKTQEALTGHLTPAIQVTASLRAFEAVLAGLPEQHTGTPQHTEEQKWLTSASSSPTLQRLSPSR